MARFVIPASRLAELREALKRGPAELRVPRRLTVILRSDGEPRQALSLAAEDVESVSTFLADFPESRVEGFEVVVPAALTAAPGDASEGPSLLSYVLELRSVLERKGFSGASCFFEAGWQPQALERVASAIRLGRAEATGRGKDFLKLRTGSIRAVEVPGVNAVAHALATCARYDVGFKATAGLHEPLRHFDPTVGVDVHGFFNVFLGGMFARALALDEAALLPLLEERDAKAFRFEKGGISWGRYFVSSRDVKNLRERFTLGFGSCSFDEPVQGLASLGLL